MCVCVPVCVGSKCQNFCYVYCSLALEVKSLVALRMGKDNSTALTNDMIIICIA